MKKAIIVCGPTASGKTHFAHKLAKKHRGEIVNADSMQIYKQLPVITASPSPDLKQELPYHLYNFQDIDKEFSVTKYIKLAGESITGISQRGNLPVIVGGSGMYINMLVYGYSPIPEIDPAVRNRARYLHKKLGSQDFFSQLNLLDPDITKLLNVGDTQRVIRAFEVVTQTGKSLLEFHQAPDILPLPNFDFEIILLLPDRKILYETCNNRFVELFEENGAVEEIIHANKQYPDINISATKALGFKEITAYTRKEISKQETIDLASAKTRQYAKRQCTWFSNKLQAKKTLRFSTISEYNNLI
jgi:tRNA dimethylallyltransferase